MKPCWAKSAVLLFAAAPMMRGRRFPGTENTSGATGKQHAFTGMTELLSPSGNSLDGGAGVLPGRALF